MRTRARAAGVAGGLIAALALALAPAASARDATVRSFDGTPIITHFFPAPGLAPGAKAPTVLKGHGYGFTGDADATSGSDSVFGQVGNGPLQAAGYNVLTWDARGFGGSGGEVKQDSPDFEGRDVQALISYVARQPEALLDAVGDPRVGMNGPSYGGGIQLVTAGIDRRVDAITPTIAWNSLLTSLYKDGVVKTGWGSILQAGTASAVLGGAGSPAGPQTGGQDPAVTKAAAEGASTGRLSPESVRYFESRGPGRLLEKIRAPTLLLQGTPDTLFTPKEAIVNHAILKRNGVPVRMLWFCGGHGVCLGGDRFGDAVEKAVINWFDRWLRRRRSVKTGPPFDFFPDGGGRKRGVTFPPESAGTIGARGSGTLPISPSGATSGGGAIAATPAPDAFNLDVKPPRANSDIVGEPLLHLEYRGSANPAATHLFAQILDVNTGHVVGNQARPIPVLLDGKSRTVDRPLEPVAALAGPGSRFRLQLAPSSNLYAYQRSTGTVDLVRVGITMPLVDLAAKPRLRLVVGKTRGMLRARRGRPFRVRIRSFGGGAREVRVAVRDRLGRRFGRSTRFRLGRRSRRVRVRVPRRLSARRYRIVARGLSSEGIPLRGSRRVRVRR